MNDTTDISGYLLTSAADDQFAEEAFIPREAVVACALLAKRYGDAVAVDQPRLWACVPGCSWSKKSSRTTRPARHLARRGVALAMQSIRYAARIRCPGPRHRCPGAHRLRISCVRRGMAEHTRPGRRVMGTSGMFVRQPR
jgi:hypothetical protein